MRSKSIPGLALLLAGAVGLAGCTGAAESFSSASTASAAAASADLQGIDPSALFSDRDREIGYDEESAAHITLTGTGAETDSDAVSVEGSTVTITDEGVYILTGSLEDGWVVVNADDTDKIQLVLDGVSIAHADGAAIYAPSADKVFITTAAGSANALENGGSYTAVDDNNIDGVIFSKCDLTLNGAGSLSIQATAGHGVVSKDDLVVTSGSYTVTAADQGLSGKDSVAIADGTFVLDTGKDAIQSDNTEDTDKGYVYLAGGDYTITSQGDGVSASSWLWVAGGSYTVSTGGGSENGEDHTQAQTPGNMGGMGGRGQRPDMTGDMGDFDPSQRPEMPEGMEDFDPDAMPQPPEGTEQTDFSQRPEDGGQPPELPADMQQTGTEQPAQVAQETTESTGQTDAADTSADTAADTADTPSTKGFKAGTALLIEDGSFAVDCADDAFHTNGDLTWTAGEAAVATGDDAFHADGDLLVEGGSIAVSACYEGLEGCTVTLTGGQVDITASDDGANAAGDNAADCCITITGGQLTVDAGGDCLDSNGDLVMSGGTVYLSGPENGADFALDYDGSATITGGTFIGLGMNGMAQNFGDGSIQGAILVTVDSQSAGSQVSVTDEAGNVLASWEAPKAYSAVVISCPGLQQGGSYTVTAGSSSTQITLDSLVYGSGMQPGGMGGRGQRP